MTGFTDLTPAYDVAEFINKDVLEVIVNKSLDKQNIQSSTKVIKVSGDLIPSGNTISLKGQTTDFEAGDIFAMDEDLTSTQFRIVDVIKTSKDGALYTNLEYKGLKDDDAIVDGIIGKKIYKIARTQSACAEVPYSNDIANYDDKYDSYEHTVENYNTFDEDKKSLGFVNNTAKLKIFAKTPGTNGNSIDVAIANVEDFNAGKYLKSGIALDGQFDYVPYGDQFAIIVFYENELVESFIVSFDETAKNDKNEFIFVETAINGNSEYILVSVNEALPASIKTCLGDDIIKLSCGSYSEAGTDDIEDGYNTFANKEEMDIDIIIGNELYPQAATSLAMERADCVAYIGAPREVSVGQKAANATTKTVEYRKSLGIDSKYVALYANYKYQYCSELGGNRWVNLAGDAAGVRAKTNFDTANWYAAAGLNRGIIKNAVKLAFSPSQSYRDLSFSSINNNEELSGPLLLEMRVA